jgi:hypothetical protein
VCSRFKFALAVPIQTSCSIATSPRSSQATPAGPHALGDQTPRFATKAPHAPQAVKPARVASGERLYGVGLAILHHPPASVMLRSSQIRRSRNRAPSIRNLNTPG